MAKKIVLIIAVVLFITIAWLAVRFIIGGPEDTWLCVNGEWVKHGNPSVPKSSEPCAFKKITSFNECLQAGYPVMESYPRQCRDGQGNLFVEDIGNELEKINLIQVAQPRPNEKVSSPLKVAGQARGSWYFEASFPVKLLDEKGELLATGIATAEGEWMTTEFVPFQAVLNFLVSTATRATLVLEKDNPSGLPENADELRMPVLMEKTETMTVKIFFNNNQLDPEFSCNKVFPVARAVAKTQASARAALEELLKGVTAAEKEEGFFTNINQGVKIQKLVIENEVAKVDFNEELERAVGGSCRAAAIRAQITQTLKQFPTVNKIIISINGRTEDILQP